MTTIEHERVEPARAESLPLCVDLDGTLVRTDTLHEQLLFGLRDWRTLIQIPGLIWRGKAVLKDALAAREPVAVAHLPFNADLLDWLKGEKQTGRTLVLATAASERVARAVGAHVGIFDDVIASTATVNLRGEAKAAALVERFGERGFVYAGDHVTDIAVWQSAASAVLVGVSPAVKRRVAGITNIDREFAAPRGRLSSLIRACRPYQWSKNILVFVPLVAARAGLHARSLLGALLMFLAFSLSASGVYVVNDLTDLAADRKHPRKRLRPFASGDLPVSFGAVLAPALLAGGVALGGLARAPWIIPLYVTLSTLYSLRFKEFPLVDIFALACLYTLRLYGGGTASGHQVSLWLLAFSSFFFLSLAAMKRVSELESLRRRGQLGQSRRDYSAEDLQVLTAFGCSSAFVASLVLALYVQADFGSTTDPRGLLLWAIVPLLLFWQCRMWLSTARGYMQDDPIVYAARDWVSRLVVVGLLVAFTLGNVR